MTSERQQQLQVSVPAPRMTTGELMAMLRASFGAAEDASRISKFQGAPELFVEEVEAPGTNRRCDLLRIGLWKSRGAGHITVYELKVSRADWRKELDSPAKAEAWWQYCHEFYIVAPLGVVKPEELPPGWGLLAPPSPKSRSKRFRVLVKADQREAKLTPLLVASIVARADNMRRAQIGELNDRHRAALDRAVSEFRQREARAELGPDDRRRLKYVERLEKLLEVQLSDYPWPPVGAVEDATPDEVGRALRDYVHDHIAAHRAHEELGERAERLRPALDSLRELLDAAVAETGTARRRDR